MSALGRDNDRNAVQNSLLIYSWKKARTGLGPRISLLSRFLSLSLSLSLFASSSVDFFAPVSGKLRAPPSLCLLFPVFPFSFSSFFSHPKNHATLPRSRSPRFNCDTTQIAPSMYHVRADGKQGGLRD
jgi:hypothetical protein